MTHRTSLAQLTGWDLPRQIDIDLRIRLRR